MEFFADWHTHSKYSDGRGSIEENTLAAIDKGLEQLGITDHGPANIGAGVQSKETFENITEEVSCLNKKYEQITLMTGAEANIIALDGTIDLEDWVSKRLDILIVGLHPFVFPARLKELWPVVGLNQFAQVSLTACRKARVNNTKALKEAVYKYDIDIISHPDLKMPVDITELAVACAATNTAVEINTGHHYDKDALVRLAEKEGASFVVSSDAHFPESVGELTTGGILLEKYNVPPDRVMNAKTVDV